LRSLKHITAALAALPTERSLLDGELVVLDEDGRSNFTKPGLNSNNHAV
jgi:ATP-dependent DNA ligase